MGDRGWSLSKGNTVDTHSNVFCMYSMLVCAFVCTSLLSIVTSVRVSTGGGHFQKATRRTLARMFFVCMISMFRVRFCVHVAVVDRNFGSGIDRGWSLSKGNTADTRSNVLCMYDQYVSCALCVLSGFCLCSGLRMGVYNRGCDGPVKRSIFYVQK